MEFKKTIKRIVALGAGASMVGATIFGAMAADLAQYPNQFVKDGKFTGVLVVGDKAAAEDVIGVSDIAVSLQFAATKPVTVTSTGGVTAEGDAWKVGTSTKILELSENVGSSNSNVETIRNITTFIDDSELDALASGTVSNGKGDAPYNQYLYLLGANTGVSSGYVIYTENDQDTTADFLYFKSGTEIGRYLMEFTTALESDVDDSAGSASTSGTYLTDLEDVDINIFGKTYSIVQARRQTGNAQVKLILMGGAVKDTLLEGNTKTYTIDGKDYETTLDFVSSTSGKFTINGESTRKLLDGETDKLSDGTTVGVSEILYQDYAGGVHSTTFFLGAQKMELRDTNISDVISTNALKLDDNTIDDAYVIIEGTDDNSAFKLNRIHVNMTADDDFFVPAGGKLSENPDLDEPQVLFTSNWDIEYRGLTEQEIETIELETSGNKKYVLKFKDGDGNEVKLPIAEAVSASNIEFGEKDKALINAENMSITKDDYIILTDSTQNRGERKTYVLQYKGADKSTADNPVLKFKDIGSGETIEQTYSVPSSPETMVGPAGSFIWKFATLKVGGADYVVYNNSVATSNDFSIVIDQNSNGVVGGINNTINITTWYGMEIGIENRTNNQVNMSFKTPDNSRDGSGTQDNVETLQATDYAISVSANSDTKVAISVAVAGATGGSIAALTEKTPDGETDVQYAYTSYGTFITRKSPSSEPGTLKFEYPKAQREAQVYITAKGATFTATAAATTQAVTLQRIDVGATKLASEVPNIKAVNSILVGGPCANAAARIIMGDPADCLTAVDIGPGEGLIKLYENNGNVAMLVAGYNPEDTRKATGIIAKYGDYKAQLKGNAVKVTTATSQVTEFVEAVPVAEPVAPVVPTTE